jgi:hypothetical protein
LAEIAAEYQSVAEKKGLPIKVTDGPMNKKILYGTFFEKLTIPIGDIRKIFESLKLNKIYIFKIVGENKYLVTFNIDEKKKDKVTEYKKTFTNTIRLNRKKNTNTFFTMNALNEIIKQNSSDDLKWDDYSDCCLLFGKDKKIQVLKTELYDIIEY